MKHFRKTTTILLAIGFLLGTALTAFATTPTLSPNKVRAAKNLTLIKGIPDLIVSIDATPGLQAGKTIPHCKVKVTNIGKGIAKGTQSAGNKGYMVDIVLSSDNTIPMSLASYSSSFHEDVLLQGGRISTTPDLKPGQSKIFDLSGYLKIPANTPPGGYCIGGFVDSGKKIRESNERNNTTCKEVKIARADKPFQVVYPSNTQHFQIVSSKIKIKVRFNRSVNRRSVRPGRNFIVRTTLVGNAPGSIVWVDAQTLIWTSNQSTQSLLQFDPDADFKLIIEDSVEDTTGVKLDGDKNGVEGGVFINPFRLIG